MQHDKVDGVIGVVIAFVTGLITYLNGMSVDLLQFLNVELSYSFFSEKVIDIIIGTFAAFCFAFAGLFGKNVAASAYRMIVKKIKSKYFKKK